MIRAPLLLILMLQLGAVVAQLTPADAPANNTNPRCGPDCVRCAADGCVKCTHLLIWPGATCGDTCPVGTREAWAHDDHLMGRVCYPSTNYNEILVGAACGGVVCLVLVIAGATYARCRNTAQARAQPLPQRPRHDDDAKLRDFHKQLDCLRPHAYTLLAILNNTRHKVRDLYQLGNNDAAMAYSCVLSDLAKLLILLNKQHVPVVPDEWPRLACWAERVLKRYTRSTTDLLLQTGPLVNIVQAPASHASDSDTTQSFTTFKPPIYSPCPYPDSFQEKELENQNLWDEVGRPPSYSQIERERETIILSDPWERRPVRRESVWLEDELFEMTRRPQDELTTEL